MSLKIMLITLAPVTDTVGTRVIVTLPGGLLVGLLLLPQTKLQSMKQELRTIKVSFHGFVCF